MPSAGTSPRGGFPLIAFICETDADLMPHFVRWYRRLGVDRFHLIVHGPKDEANLAALAAMPGVEITQRLHEPFCRSLKCDAITAVARRYAGRWIVLADGLHGMVEALESAGIDELYATLLQQVAADGSLPEVHADSDLDALFPMFHLGLCEDMGLERPAWRSKYPLAKVGPDFVYQRGNHLPGNSRSLAHVPMRGVMHHFKWRSRLLEAFRRERGEGTNSHEMATYRAWLGNHGRLPMAGAKPSSTRAIESEGLLRRPTPEESAVLAAMRNEREVAAREKLRIGFVTFELGGPGTPNGGVATAISASRRCASSPRRPRSAPTCSSSVGSATATPRNASTPRPPASRSASNTTARSIRSRRCGCSRSARRSPSCRRGRRTLPTSPTRRWRMGCRSSSASPAAPPSWSGARTGRRPSFRLTRR